jgi:hypothetical protein
VLTQTKTLPLKKEDTLSKTNGKVATLPLLAVGDRGEESIPTREREGREPNHPSASISLVLYKSFNSL